MSCEVKPFASVPDLKKVQEHFGFSLDENWLNAVYYSISPTGETIAFGHGNKIIILCSQWLQSNQQLPTYQITWKGELDNENDIITAILCIPIYGSNISSGADWTCILIGLASGLVLFYSDSGLQIFSQRWHNENVQSIKAQSGNRIAEEIHIYYLSCVCILNGVELFPTLKGHKQNLSKTLKSTTSSRTTNLTQFPDIIQCRKWEYRTRSDSSINDACIVGSNQKQSIFDHYLEQSLEKGYYAKLRSSPAQNSLVLGVGVKPYCGFYYAKEGFVQADLGDVAKAMANKVISSLPGWFFGSSNKSKSSTKAAGQKDNSVENEQPIESGEPMICRFGICDLQRQAFNIWLAPDNNLAVITDNLSRVILIDCNRGIAIRIWKGYRDAQCAFMKIKEKTLKSDKNEKRKSLFLIIYAPRRSCLEIWTLQHGPKVAAFNISKNGQLSYTTYGLMGINPGAKVKFNVNSCLFLDPSDETIKEIHIPFHCSLNDTNSNTAKDVHLLRRMKLYIRNDDTNEIDIIPEIQELCSNIKTDEIRLQLLEMLSKNKKLKPKIFLVAIETLKTSINCEQTEQIDLNRSLFDQSQSQHHIRLVILLENYEKLVKFYIALKETKSDTSEKLNFSKLSLTENDLETIQKLLDLTIDQKLSQPSQNHTNKVKFQDNKQNSSEFIEFLSIFNVENNELILNDNKKQLYGYIGGNLFSRFLEKGYDFNGFIESTNNFDLPSEDLMVLVLHYWLEKQFCYTKCEEIIDDMARLAIIIRHICDLADNKLQFDYNEICQWWQNGRELLLESSSALKSLLAAIVCRNVSNSLKKRHRESSSDDSEELFEEVSQETAQWSLLIGKLDDISVLGAILSFPVTSSKPIMPIIPYEKPDCSLKRIICGGKGIVSELFAKWLTNSGIHPKELLENENSKVDIKETDTTKNDLEDNSNNIIPIDPVIQHFHHLREHFPFSLESGVLYCQMTWEFMSYWSKNLQKLEYLKAGLICLDSFRIEDLALKHGLCCMIWNAHLKIPLEATKKLIHKVGRLPKEKLCQQDIGMSVTSVPEFLEFTLDFLKHFLTSLEHEKRELQYEEILQNEQIPLSFLALQQNHAIYDIVKLHIELCKVLHLIAFFSLKLTKPITMLFDAMSNQTFFIEINRELNYQLPISDLVMKKNREEFLCRTVSASMDLIREDLERLYVLEHATYMNKIEELADLWELDKNVIKKHQIVEMYAHGWDAYAEELLEAIVDQESIGPLLLEIAGRRLNLYASNSQSIFCQVASIGPQLLNYLDNLKIKTTGCQITAELPDEIELESMLTLAAKAFHCLSTKESKSLHIAGQLFDACSLLKSLSTKD